VADHAAAADNLREFHASQPATVLSGPALPGPVLSGPGGAAPPL
jgi:hypothetical protein